MTAEAPKGGLLPLLLMTLLVGCLATFVGLKLFQTDRLEPKLIHPQVENPVENEHPVKKEPVDDPIKDPPVDPKKTDEDVLREKQEPEYRNVLTEYEKLKRDRKWTSARTLLVNARKSLGTFTDALDAEIKSMNELIAESEKYYERDLIAARDSLNKLNFLEAAKLVASAEGRAPELTSRAEEAAKLRQEIKERLLFSNMVRIAGGEVTLGDPAELDEPARKVVVKTFRIDAFEVTVDQYAVFVMMTGARSPWGPAEPPKGQEKLPVVGVSYADAQAFAVWAGKRLPTQDEWERAARFVDGRKYPWGDKFVGDDAKFHCCTVEFLATGKGEIKRMPVGSFPTGKSPEGVYDLAGNVWEWTSTKINDLVVLKGGSFLTTEKACRAAARMLEDPTMRHPDVGFRCAADVDN